jgi:phage baseplate assembly protein W
MAGMDRNTGKALIGFAHVEQSIGVLLTTPRMRRVMRRAFGSDLVRLVDAPINQASLIEFYAATAKAINMYEPRFRVSRLTVEGAERGRIKLRAEGTYYPRGHLGDFSISSAEVTAVLL